MPNDTSSSSSTTYFNVPSTWSWENIEAMPISDNPCREVPAPEPVPQPEPFSGLTADDLNAIYNNINIRSYAPPRRSTRIDTEAGTVTGRYDYGGGAPLWEEPSEDTIIRNMGRAVARIEESVSMLEQYEGVNFTSATTAVIGTLCGQINKLRNKLWRMHDKFAEQRRLSLLREAE